MKKAAKVLGKSFYSSTLYREAAHLWSGTGIGLLAGIVFLLMLVFVPLGFLTFDLSEYRQMKESFYQQTPTITIERGTLSIDRPSPYFISSGEGNPLLLIDPSDATAALPIEQTIAMMKEYGVNMFLGKTTAISIKSSGEYRIYDLADVGKDSTIRFDGTDVKRWVEAAELFGVPFMALMFYLYIFVYAIIQMLLYSIAGIIIGKIARAGLNYSAIQRITTCAIVPSSVLVSATGLFGHDLHFLVCFAITIGYLIFGIVCARTAKLG